MVGLVKKAVAHDRVAVRILVDKLTPIIQARAAKALLRHQRAAGGRDVRQEVKDLTQQVFLILFDHGGRALLKWDPDRGASLESFVGLLAEREIFSILRARSRNPWAEDPTEAEDLDRMSERTPGAELNYISKDLLQRILERVRARLSERGFELFQWIVIEDRSVEEVAGVAGMTPDAVYAWRSRLTRLLRELAAEVSSDSED